MSEGTTKSVRFGVKFVLLAGFSGVLGLMALAGLDSVRALHQIEAQNAQITSSYLSRHRFLEQIRSDLYLSSTFVRDYLLDTNPEAARESLTDLQSLQAHMNSALQGYSHSIHPEEQKLFSDLAQQVNGYWSSLTPTFRWGPDERRAEGYAFLQMQIFPRRTLMLGIADRIDKATEQALTAGNQRSAELFGRFRRRVALILSVVLSIGLVLASGSIVQILRLEREAQLRYDEVQHARQELKRLSARLVEAQEQERRAISRELHDEIGQSLNALLVDLGNLAAITPAGAEEAHRLLGTAKELTTESVNALRNVALLLRPSMLDDFGLVPALHWQAREVSRRTGMLVTVEAGEVSEELPDEHKTCVYRIVQEALHNCSRHAAARTVRIAIRQESGRIVLAIQDDGKGFEVAQVRGLGLLGMEERVNHLGGRFHIQSWPGQGTLLRIDLPLMAAQLQASKVSI